MKTEVKKIDSTTRQMNTEVSGEIVKNKFDDIFKKVAKDAKVSGFRPGHVPRNILEKHYSSHVQEEVIRELVPDIYNQAITQEGLDVVDLPKISDVKLNSDTLSFTATIEVSPQIVLSDYKGLKVTYKKIEVSPDEIKRSLDSIKESRKVDNLDGAFARSLGYPNLATLEQAIEKQLFIQKENEQRRKIEDGIVEQLTKDIDVKVPASLLKRQSDDLLRQAKLDLALKGVARQKIDEQEKELLKELEPQARHQVKVYLLLSEIAKKENIALDDHMAQHVMEFLLREADWQEIA